MPCPALRINRADAPDTGHPRHPGQGGQAIGCSRPDSPHVRIYPHCTHRVLCLRANMPTRSLYTIVKALDYGNANPDLCKI
jgi:hypothetical protein